MNGPTGETVDPSAVGMSRRTVERYDQIVPAGKTLIQATFAVDWASFDNDDLADEDDANPAPDCGWYVTVTLGDRSFSIGPDHYGPGFQSIDEAVAYCRKYAEDRSFEWSPPSLDFTVGKWV